MSGNAVYRGRIAPSPTGFLHRGHAATFLKAFERAEHHHGTLVLRIEDLDRERCRAEFVDALLDDLRWCGLHWQEGSDVGGPQGPYRQSERIGYYLEIWRRLAAGGAIYPCTCTRRDVAAAPRAPHADEHEGIYPGTCRPLDAVPVARETPDGVNWRFRVPVDEAVRFDDGCAGPQEFQSGHDFRDFVVWRKDGTPAYQLAVVTDDAAMAITEVVRGADLLLSTAQQILLYRALGMAVPAFYHCPLVTDERGRRLAKREGAHSLRAMRESGVDPATLRIGMPDRAVP